MELRKIAVINQKGGSGKTTTVVNLGNGLARLGRRVLVVDLDPQASATIHLGVDPYRLEASLADVLVDGVPVGEVVIHTQVDGLDLLPGALQLSGAEARLTMSEAKGRTALREAMGEVDREYDYVLLDCPPSLGALTVNALTAAEEVLIPVETEFYALESLKRLFEIIRAMRERLNPNLRILGFVATLYDGRTRLSRDVLGWLRSSFGEKVFKAVIRKNIRLAEAPSHGLPILLYSPRSPGAQDYLSLARELDGGG